MMAWRFVGIVTLASCVPVRTVVHGERSPPRVGAPEEVSLFTPESGPPGRSHRRNGVFEVETAIPWTREGRVLPGTNRFDHLRRLRESAFERGCDALLVARPRSEYDEILCGRRNAEPLPCLLVYRATCLVFE